ncbi:MAG TPA: hypothetical protein VMV90_00320 [Rectinemataceae bacterium]|nr:hypothetical protein [Rectinemataceae bacterium]
MKGDVFGFQQRKLVEFGLDLVDALILRWLADYIASGTMKSINRDGRAYYWVQYQKCLDDLLVIGIKDAWSLSKRFAELENAGVVEKHLVKAGGTYTYFRLNERRYAVLCGEKVPKSAPAEEEPPKKRRGGAEASTQQPATKKVAEEAEPPEKERRLSPATLRFLGDVIHRGGFTNKLPKSPEAAPTKVLLTAWVFVVSVKNRDFRRRFGPLDGAWLSESGIDFPYFRKTPESRDEIVLKAVERYALMRSPDHEPVKKEMLSKSLDEFFYNPFTERSWFLYCVFNEPKPITRKVSASERYEGLGFGPKTKAAVESLRGKGWDREPFLRKVVELYEWYKANRKDVRAYDDAYCEGQWIHHFEPFSEFLDRYRDFSEIWNDWRPGNFGYGNATWKQFASWCRGNYKGLELALSKAKVEKVWAELAKNAARTKSPAEYEAERREFEAREEEFRRSLLAAPDDPGVEKPEAGHRKRRRTGCPYGHVFRKDIDKYPECGDCAEGTACYREKHPGKRTDIDLSKI